MMEKIINFKYNNNKNNHKMASKPKTTSGKWKKLVGLIKHKWGRFTDKLTKITIKIIAWVVNIDVMPVFIFFSSYIITFDFPIVWRAIISIAIYQIYKMFIKDMVSIMRGRMK